MMTLRPAAERGHAEHGWLDSWHSFSFGDYRDPRHVHFGPLRVINEDRVRGGAGFPPHSHADMEIISYVLAGELAHKDSMGNGSIIRPGDVQRMSAGRGVQHSEFNPSPDAAVHFLQLWIIPDVTGIAPEYEQRHFSDAEKRGRLRLLASPDGVDGSLRIHQDARLYAARLQGAEQLRHALGDSRLGYVQVARGSLKVNGQSLQAGDGLMLNGEPSMLLADGIGNGSDDGGAEVLVFDLPDA